MRLIQHHHRTAACEYGIAMHLRAREYLLGVETGCQQLRAQKVAIALARRKTP